MPCTTLFSQTDTIATRILYHIVFNNPSLTPMSCHHPYLLSCRSCPLCSRLTHMESSESNVVQPLPGRVKTGRTYRYFYGFLIGVCFSKISIDSGMLTVNHSKPHSLTSLWIANTANCIGSKNLFLISHFIQRNIIQIHIPSMKNTSIRPKPITKKTIIIGIIVTKEMIIQDYFPNSG